MIVNQVDHRTVHSAVELATRAPSVHNSQPWRWRIADRSVHLYADRARRLPATDPDGRDWILSCGAALHHLRIALAASGIAASVRRIPNPSEPDHLAALQLHDRAPDACDIRLATAITARRTDRRRYGPWPVPEVFVEELMQRAAEQGALLETVTGPDARAFVIDSIRDAEQSQHHTLGYRVETALWSGQRAGDDGVPAANLLRHGSTSATDLARRYSNGMVEQADTDRDHAQLMVLGSASDDTLSRLRVGEALSAVLLHATDLGLATCPLSQPLEVPAVRDALRDELLGGRMDPQLILRIGWAPRGEVLPATPRRLLSEQIDRFGQ